MRIRGRRLYAAGVVAGLALSLPGRSAPAREVPDFEAAVLFREIEESRGSATPASLQQVRLALDGAEATLLIFEEAAPESLRVLCLSATRAEALVLERSSFYEAALDMSREVSREMSLELIHATPALAADTSRAQMPGSVRCGRMLASLLQAPLEAAERLYIVPPFALDACPFELVRIGNLDQAAPGTPSPVRATRLGESLPISYLPNGSCLVALSRPRLWTGANLVAFTDPAAASEASLRPVRGAPAAIGVSRGEPHVYSGAAATPEALLRIATEKPVVLHLDLVACSDGIAFGQGALAEPAVSSSTPRSAPPPPSAPPEKVALDELRGLGLTTDLTVISQTVASPGAIHRVPEALLAGGARSVTVPRWPVDPEAAEMFLDHFYEGLFAALPRDEAMRKARAALAERGVPLAEQLAFAHWGAGNLRVYIVATKGNPFPLVVAWLLFLPPVIASVVWLRRRYLRRVRESSGQTTP